MNTQNERRVGQIIMACNIIKSENRNQLLIPKVTLKDISIWMNADEAYVSTLVRICAALDRTNIVKDILLQEGIGCNNVELWGNTSEFLAKSIDTYVAYLLSKISKRELEQIVSACTGNERGCILEKENFRSVLHKCTKQLVSQVNLLCDTEGLYKTAVLEIAELSYLSIDEYEWLNTMLTESKEHECAPQAFS